MSKEAKNNYFSYEQLINQSRGTHKPHLSVTWINEWDQLPSAKHLTSVNGQWFEKTFGLVVVVVVLVVVVVDVYCVCSSC